MASSPKTLTHPAATALQWYLDNGVDEILSDTPLNRFNMPDETAISPSFGMGGNLSQKNRPQNYNQSGRKYAQPPAAGNIPQFQQTKPLMGQAELTQEAARLAGQAQTLDELKAAIESFDGLAVKKTATNMVFSDGNPNAHVMVIGEAPGADEDRQGKPFVGVSGQLLDKIIACIGLSRLSEKPEDSVYISNILNWRPPGNRTPTATEIEISMPFIEKHIALIKPKILILCGSVAAKGILSRTDSVSKLRKGWHDFTPRHLAQDFSGTPDILARVTYHPAYLLRTPTQKAAVWKDMLEIQAKIGTL